MIVKPSLIQLALCASIAVVGMVSLGSSLQAQDDPDTITVTAPRHVGHTSAGTPIEMVTVIRLISYHDLDIQTAAGVAELNKRVAAAAHAECGELERKYPIGYPDALACANKAMAEAQLQIHDTIALQADHSQ